MNTKLKTIGVATLFCFAGAWGASASVVSLNDLGYFDGNGCNIKKDEVTLPDDFVPGDFDSTSDKTTCSFKLSDVILKFDDYDDSDTPGSTVVNPKYAGFETDAITISFSEEFSAGTFKYDPQGDDPIGISGMYFKGANGYQIYEFSEVYYGGAMEFGWGIEGGSNLSNFVLFNTDDDPGDFVVPVPAGLPLILTGLGVMGVLRARERKQA